MNKNPLRWLPSLRDSDPPRLWRIGYALAACFAVAVAGLATLWLAALALLNYPKLPHSRKISLHDTVGVAQLVFASVAGAGALVALVMAYRRQRVSEATSALDRARWEVMSAHDRTRLLNERFTTIAAQLGDDQAAVRLAGVHAMAGLADDWEENRQTCIDVLCAYLRMPYQPDPGETTTAAKRLEFRSSREVRHTVIRVIAAHLQNDAATSWQGLNFDFTGAVFDGGDFYDANFSRGIVSFDNTKFAGGAVSFDGTRFSGGVVTFRDTEFSGGTVSFDSAEFSDGIVTFEQAKFAGGKVSFDGVDFPGGTVSFRDAEFAGGEVIFDGAIFSGGRVGFSSARFTEGTIIFAGAIFSGGEVSFDNAKFSGGEVSFSLSRFSGGEVSFDSGRFSNGTISFTFAEFSGGTVSFHDTEFSGGTVSFDGAEFSGSDISFSLARFSGGTVDFSHIADWSHPPEIYWNATPPTGLKLPLIAIGEP